MNVCMDGWIYGFSTVAPLPMYHRIGMKVAGWVHRCSRAPTFTNLISLSNPSICMTHMVHSSQTIHTSMYIYNYIIQLCTSCTSYMYYHTMVLCGTIHYVQYITLVDIHCFFVPSPAIAPWRPLLQCSLMKAQIRDN